MHRASLSVLAACGVLASLPAQAADNDLKSLREEIAQMRQAYEQRINALEARLIKAESTADSAQTVARQTAVQQTSVQQALAQQPTVQQAVAPTQSNSFNPEMSMILMGSYNNLKQDPNAYQITGFVPTLGEVGPGARGFSLGESELVLSANIDPNWRGTAILALAPEGGVNMENAYFESLGLGNGFSFKGGRFYSGIGYMNEQHAHAWDFADAPLAYKAFLGNQLGDDGVQVRWLAPTDLFLNSARKLAADALSPAPTTTRMASRKGRYSRIWAATRASATPGAWGCRGWAAHPKTAALMIPTARVRPPATASAARAGCGLPMASGNGHRMATARCITSSCRASISNAVRTARWRAIQRRALAQKTVRLITTATRAAGMCRASISSCRIGALACVTMR